MQVFEYVIQRGDSLGQIAKKFTGNKDRWIEMLEVNPQIPKMRNQWGQKTFVPQRFQVGMRIFLPYGWISGRGVVMGPEGTVSGAASGTVGESCSPTPVPHYPGVLYIVHDGKMPSASVADDFGVVTSGGFGDFNKLNGANVNFWSKGFSLVNGSCVPNGWKDGIALRVPKAWLEIPASQLAQLPALSHLVLESDGVTPWVPPTGGGGAKTPGVPGTQGDCPDGQVLAGDGVTCIAKGSGTGVGAKDEGFKTSTVLWVLLAAGAGIGGALLLNNLIKAKHVRVAPPGYPALPPAQVKEEVVVRR